mgnify:CR=1 FL=1
MDKKRAKGTHGMFDKAKQSIAKEGRHEFLSMRLRNIASTERRIRSLEGKPALVFAKYERELAKAAAQIQPEKFKKRPESKRPGGYSFVGNDHFLDPSLFRPMAVPGCDIKLGTAMMDSITSRHDSNSLLLIDQQILQIGRVRGAGFSPKGPGSVEAALNGSTSEFFWESEYKSQIVPHPCKTRLQVRGRVLAHLGWGSNGPEAPLIRVVALGAIQPDITQPLPELATFVGFPDLYVTGPGFVTPVEGTMRLDLGTSNGAISSSAALTMEQSFVLWADVPPGAQSQFFLDFMVSTHNDGSPLAVDSQFTSWSPPASSIFHAAIEWGQYPF